MHVRSSHTPAFKSVKLKTYDLSRMSRRSVGGLGLCAVLTAFGAFVPVSPVALVLVAGMPPPTATAAKQEVV